MSKRYNPAADPRVETQCERCGTWFVLNPWQLPVTSCFNCEGQDDGPVPAADQHDPFDGTGELFGDTPGWSEPVRETAERIATRNGPKPASDRQRDYLRDLERDRVAPDGYVSAADDPALTSRDASGRIDILRAASRKPRQVSPAAPARRVVVTEDGMYRTADGTIWKVQRAIHGTGNLYAKRLNPPASYGGRATFTFVPGAIRDLVPADRMSLEDARAFGALYGTCCNCGRTLTNETSIDLGIGPVCRKGFRS